MDSIQVGFQPTDIREVISYTVSYHIATSIVPSAAFILNIFERLPQNKYNDVIKSLSIPEQNKLLDNPRADNVVNFFK